jgi:outer membrane phospholipase A
MAMGANNSFTVTAYLNGHSGPAEIAPKTFKKRAYTFKFPENKNGRFDVTIAGYEEEERFLTVSPPEAMQAGAQPPENPELPEDHPTLGDIFSLYQPYIANISAYEPIYFLVGTDPEESKFQLSLKYRLFNPEGSLSKKFSWLQGIHLGYTQTSFWDLKSDSAPFEDTSYKPELFFLSDNFKTRPGWLEGLFLQTGIRHESNGRGLEFSRSTNYAYVKPYLIYYNPRSQLGFHLSPKILYYFHNDDDTNPDLADYRGYVDIEAKFGKAEGFVLTSHLRPAKEGVSFQADLSYPISNLINNNFDLYLQLQYTNSLAESLLDYQDRTETLRVGFSIVR